MNLTSVSAFIREYKWAIVTGLLVILAIPLVVLSFLPKKTPTVNQIEPISFESKNFGANNIDTSALQMPQNYPKDLPVFQNKTTESLVAKAQQLAQRLGITTAPVELSDINLGDGVSYSNNQAALTVYPQSLSYKNFQESSTSAALDPQQLKTEAVNFISSLGFPANFSNQFTTTYFRTFDEFSEVTPNPQEAGRVVIELSYELANAPVINSKAGVAATFDAGAKLRKITYFPLTTSELSQKYSIISPQDALEDLPTRGVPIVVNAPNDYSPPSTSFSQIALTHVGLAYYFNTASSLIQPVWVFTATTADNTVVKYAVPAIGN